MTPESPRLTKVPMTEPAPAHAPAPDAPTLYRFRCWWGGEVVTSDPPRIGQLLLDLRRKVGGLKSERKVGGPSYAIRSANQLMEKLRSAIDDLGLVVYVAGQDGGNIDAERGTMAFIKTLVRVGAPDGSYVDFVGSGHGVATDDKAAGKASTYAWKDALIKGLSLPDADMPDTDDEEGLPTKARKGGKTKPPVDLAPFERALAACKDIEALDRLVSSWKPGGASAVPPDVAMLLGPLVKARRSALG